MIDNKTWQRHLCWTREKLQILDRKDPYTVMGKIEQLNKKNKIPDLLTICAEMFSHYPQVSLSLGKRHSMYETSENILF